MGALHCEKCGKQGETVKEHDTQTASGEVYQIIAHPECVGKPAPHGPDEPDYAKGLPWPIHRKMLRVLEAHSDYEAAEAGAPGSTRAVNAWDRMCEQYAELRKLISDPPPESEAGQMEADIEAREDHDRRALNP